jgi:hypothetical protein
MTTFAVPPAGSPAWRRHYPSPPDVKLNIPAGTWCPIDDTTLQNRPDGWDCPTCKAAWNFHGLAGRWLDEPVRWRPSAVLVLAGLAGCAAAAAVLVAVLGELDQRLVWWLSAAIAAATVLYVAAGWLSRQIADRPYRHNRVIATYDSVEQAMAAPVAGEVSDER